MMPSTNYAKYIHNVIAPEWHQASLTWLETLSGPPHQLKLLPVQMYHVAM